MRASRSFIWSKWWRNSRDLERQTSPLRIRCPTPHSLRPCISENWWFSILIFLVPGSPVEQLVFGSPAASGCLKHRRLENVSAVDGVVGGRLGALPTSPHTIPFWHPTVKGFRWLLYTYNRFSSEFNGIVKLSNHVVNSIVSSWKINPLNGRYFSLFSRNALLKITLLSYLLNHF